MTEIEIKSVRWNNSESLYVEPRCSQQVVPFVYRAGMGVYWDEKTNAFVFQTKEGWDPERCLAQILRAAKDELGIQLRITTATSWEGVPSELVRKWTD